MDVVDEDEVESVELADVVLDAVVVVLAEETLDVDVADVLSAEVAVETVDCRACMICCISATICCSSVVSAALVEDEEVESEDEVEELSLDDEAGGGGGGGGPYAATVLVLSLLDVEAEDDVEDEVDCRADKICCRS